MNRPASATVFGILNIIFGAIGILGLVYWAAMFFAAKPDPNNPVMGIVAGNPMLALWTKASFVLGGVASVVLLLSGIGLLQLQPWARTASIIYAVYSIVMAVVGLVVSYFFLFGPLMELAQHSRGPVEAAAAFGGAIGAIGGPFLSVIYPILLLIFMKRPNVVAAFRDDESTTGPDWQ